MATAVRLESGFVKVGRLSVHHTYGGKGAPPVLFVHGLGSSGYIEWRFTLPAIARRHRVLAPDLPGFGRTDKPRGGRYGIAYFARALVRYLDIQELARVAVVGRKAAWLGSTYQRPRTSRHGFRLRRDDKWC